MKPGLAPFPIAGQWDAGRGGGVSCPQKQAAMEKGGSRDLAGFQESSERETIQKTTAQQKGDTCEAAMS